MRLPGPQRMLFLPTPLVLFLTTEGLAGMGANNPGQTSSACSRQRSLATRRAHLWEEESEEEFTRALVEGLGSFQRRIPEP